MKHRNDPTRNLIMTWRWGPDRYEVYTEVRKAPRWIRNYGSRLGSVWGTCGVAGCKYLPDDREWYVRHPFLGVVCQDCAKRHFGVEPPGKG